MDNKIETTDNGEIEVQIAPIGKFNGSDANGDAVPENITKESLDVLANRLNATNEEVLVDIDHASVRPGLDRDTRAAGWLSKFFTTVKGLFAKMKLTGHGKKLVEEREFRYLSPVFTLGSSGEPVELHSVAFTNTPAFTGAINPIVNHGPIQDDKQMEIEDMSKEELIGLIKETVKAMNSEEKAEEVVEETKDEVVSPTEETTKEEVVENTCVENTCSEENDVKNSETETEVEETKEEEVKEEIKEEAKPEVEDEEEEEEKEEVIKIDALNSKPTALGDVSGKEDWMNLHGEAFWKYLAEHPEIKG